MGKKKDKYKVENYNSAFTAYMADISATGMPESDETPFPDSMKASTLLEQIGAERSWLQDQIESDLIILEENRIYTVKDLRILSLDSWKEIKLLPLVKDLLRDAISRGQLAKDDKLAKKLEKQARKAQKKQKMAEIREKRQQEKSVNNQDRIVNEKAKEAITPFGINEEKIDKSGASYSSKSSDSLSSSDSSDEMEVSQQKRSSSALFPPPPAYSFTSQKPNKQVIGNRLRIRTATGQAYEVDRYCPHKKVDLTSRGVVLGSRLICTKHNWEFSLDQGGRCNAEGATINACPINDW